MRPARRRPGRRTTPRRTGLKPNRACASAPYRHRERRIPEAPRAGTPWHADGNHGYSIPYRGNHGCTLSRTAAEGGTMHNEPFDVAVELGRTVGRTVVFVCLHGAGKSRIAAAWFNGVAPPDWRATSAGVAPQATVSAHAARLLAGTSVESLLDHGLPRPLAAVADPNLVVAIDLPPGDCGKRTGQAMVEQALHRSAGQQPCCVR